MPKLFPPSILEDTKTQAFCLQKQITDTGSLRHHLQKSVCLGIDMEGCERIGEGITSTGLAVLPPTDFLAKTFPSLLFETQELVERYRIDSNCVYVEGPSRRKPHPSFPFGLSTKTSDPGAEIKAIVDRIKLRYAGKDIVLIGWHPHPYDFLAIQALVPSLFQEVVGWADVVDVTQQICVSKQEDLVKSWPPLGDVMLCVGFSESCLPQRFGHSRGSDTIHTVIVLARLLTYKSNELPIELRRQRLLKQWQQQQQQ